MKLNGAGAEFLGRQCHGLPLRASQLHKPDIISEFDAKENVCRAVEIVNIPSVKINVNFFDFVGEDKSSLMGRPENLLPSQKAFDIVGCHPAFETCKFGEGRAAELSALDFRNYYLLIRRVNKIIEAFHIRAAESRPLLLIDGYVLYMIIYQPVPEGFFIMIKMKILHLGF